MAETESLIRALSRLVTDSAFQRFSVLQTQPNLFRAVARTHTETWHSAFLGWLLDPLGSHALGAFPLQRFWSTVADAGVPPDDISPHFLSPDALAHLAASGDFGEAAILPNERIRTEYTFADGRADIWVELSGDEDRPPRFVGLIEMKIDAALAPKQAEKYANHVARLTSDATKAACVFIGRSRDIADTAVETTEDTRWYCIDFQALHDEVIEPCFRHPAINPQMKSIVEHYLLNMRSHSGPKGRMAITNEERHLALDIWQRHMAAFQALAEILKDQDGFPIMLASGEAGDQVSLALTVDGTELSGKTVPEFYCAVFDYIYKKKGTTVSLPFSTGKKRYLLAEDAVHPTGKPFLNARPYSLPGGLVLQFEANASRESALASARKVLESVGCKTA